MSFVSNHGGSICVADVPGEQYLAEPATDTYGWRYGWRRCMGAAGATTKGLAGPARLAIDAMSFNEQEFRTRVDDQAENTGPDS
jgi:hypothetical protein